MWFKLTRVIKEWHCCSCPNWNRVACVSELINRSCWASQWDQGATKSCQLAIWSRRCYREPNPHWPAERWGENTKHMSFSGSGKSDCVVLRSLLFSVLDCGIRTDAAKLHCPSSLQTGWVTYLIAPYLGTFKASFNWLPLCRVRFGGVYMGALQACKHSILISLSTTLCSRLIVWSMRLCLCISVCGAAAGTTIRSRQKWRGLNGTNVGLRASCQSTARAARWTVGRRAPWLRPPPPDFLLAHCHSSAKGQRYWGTFTLRARLQQRYLATATAWCNIWQLVCFDSSELTNSTHCNSCHPSGITTCSWSESWLTKDTWVRRKSFPTGRS